MLAFAALLIAGGSASPGEITIANQTGAPLTVTLWRKDQASVLGSLAPNASSPPFVADAVIVLEVAPRIDGARWFFIDSRWFPPGATTLNATRESLSWRGAAPERRFDGVTATKDAPAPLGQRDTCVSVEVDDDDVPKTLRLMPLPAGLVSRRDDAPMGFRIAGHDGRWYWFHRPSGALVLSSYDRFYGFELEFPRIVFAPVMDGTATYFEDSSPFRTDVGDVTIRVIPCP
jgi:hypothetical protein